MITEETERQHPISIEREINERKQETRPFCLQSPSGEKTADKSNYRVHCNEPFLVAAYLTRALDSPDRYVPVWYY